jgi:3-hydroxybutyryl-CoA dehydrogenase
MSSAKIKCIAILGAGVMGPGLALSYALYGYEVRIWSVETKLFATAAAVVKKSLETLAQTGLISADVIPGTVSRIGYFEDLATCVDGADYVVEAIIENAKAKQDLYGELDRILPDDVLIVSNTSVLDIFKLMPQRRLPKTLIAHWFAPAHIVPLVEVVKCDQTSDETVATTMDLLREIGKTPVLMRTYVPGFIINRLQMILNKEVFYLLDNGYVTPEELDAAVRASLAPRMMVLGLVQRIDFGGLDMTARNIENKQYQLPPEETRPPSLFDHVDRGELGVKTGKGFFDYSKRPIAEILKERDEKLLAAFACAKTCGAVGQD